MKAIKEFKGEYRFLSNFYPSKIVVGHLKFDSAEQMYQCAKATNAYDYNLVYDTYNSTEAKRAGNKIEISETWEADKLGVMFNAVYLKFSQNYELRDRLIATGDTILIEGNNWGDTYWGMVDGKGKNWLGRILMIVRSLAQQKSERYQITIKLKEKK